MSLWQDIIERARKAIARDPAGKALITGRAQPDWGETVIAGMTPGRMAAVLRDAAEGAAADFLTLAEELEEIDPHYRAVLSTRKLAVAGLQPDVEPAGDDAAAREVADFVREIVEAPAFGGLLHDLLDGLGKGYAVVRIVWDTSGEHWLPAAYVWERPQLFGWCRQRRRIMQRTEDGGLRDIAPLRAIVHVPRLKSGEPVRGALARVCAWSLLYKNYTLKDWMRFLDVYGLPLRLGKYSATATEEDKRKLLRALYALGSDAAAVVPASAQIEFVTASSAMSSSGPVFGAMAEYIDRQVSKAVLGQTMTTDDGSSLAQAQVHEEVRADIMRADARQLMATINEQLIRPAIMLNFGPQERWPVVSLPVLEPEDIRQWTENVVAFMDRGLPVSRRQVREKLGLEEPRDDDDALLLAQAGGEREQAQARAHRHGPGCPCCGGSRALATAGDAPADDEMDEIDRLVAAALPEMEEDDPLAPLTAPLRRAIAEAADYDDLRRRLAAAVEQMDDAPLRERLAVLSCIARGLGDVRDAP